MDTDIFYAPHSDDETLSMGPAILRALRSSGSVYVLLLTDGVADETRQCLNGEFLCSWHKTYHDPQKENFQDIPLDKAAFIRARRKEFLNACSLMGVPRSRIKIYDYHDNHLSKENVKKIMKEMHQKADHSSRITHHSMSYYYDNHPDHLSCGESLLELCREDETFNARWYVKKSYGKELSEENQVFSDAEKSPEGRKVLEEICREVYGKYDPERGKYAIGYHSVSNSFEALQKAYTIQYHEIIK